MKHDEKCQCGMPMYIMHCCAGKGGLSSTSGKNLLETETETDYGTVTHPMEGLRVDDYAALRAERDALSQYLIEYVKIAERKNNIGRLLFFEQQMLIRAKKALSVGKHIADNTASIKSERDALVEALKYAHSQMQPFCDDTIVKEALKLAGAE